MALTLTIDRRAWARHVAGVAAEHPGLVPVVKGNGYGFGLEPLARRAVELLAPDELAVGTVHEARRLAELGPRLTVLTPVATDELPPPIGTVLTVGSTAHVATLQRAGWTGAVLLKLASPMHRYGTTPDGLDTLRSMIGRAGLSLEGYSLHLPLPSAGADHRSLVATWLDRLGPEPITLQVSHLDTGAEAALRTAHPNACLRARIGTELWLGDKRFFALEADVVDVQAVAAGTPAGYRLTHVPGEGHLVMVSCGTAHGVTPLPDGRSPFHYARRRLDLLEPPHMHTSMLFVPAGEPVPAVGERVEVQRPLTQVWIDRLVERNGPA